MKKENTKVILEELKDENVEIILEKELTTDEKWNEALQKENEEKTIILLEENEEIILLSILKNKIVVNAR